MTKPLEKKIQRDIIKYLQEQGIFHERINSGAVMVKQGGIRYKLTLATKGFPDILILKDGRFIGCEVKKHDTKQNKDQLQMEQSILENGGEYFVARSIDDVKEYLKQK